MGREVRVERVDLGRVVGDEYDPNILYRTLKKQAQHSSYDWSPRLALPCMVWAFWWDRQVYHFRVEIWWNRCQTIQSVLPLASQRTQHSKYTSWSRPTVPPRSCSEFVFLVMSFPLQGTLSISSCHCLSLGHLRMSLAYLLHTDTKPQFWSLTFQILLPQANISCFVLL